MRFSTRAIRVGQDPDKDFGAVIPPIYQSATFIWDDLQTIPKHDYTRVTNPTRSSLEEAIASLENAKHCVCFASGMAAIMAPFHLLSCGDHLLVASDIYGGTQRVKDKLLPKFGIQADEFDCSDPHSIRAHVKPNTKMVIFETPTNPNLRLMDIRSVADVSRELGLISVIDNTFASPAIQNPLDLGIDVVVHSTTKYISGHSDIIGGCVVTNNDEFNAEFLEYIKTVGSVPSPFDCWLTLRGLKTLSVRMERHDRNAQAVAQFLEGHPQVAKVHYPGLESHADHELARLQMRGFGGMIAFEIAGSEEQARTVAESCKIFQLAESLGGVESIVGYPKLMSHGAMTEEQRMAKGIPPTMLRLSVGIEDVGDLIDDLDQALMKAFAAKPQPEFALA